MNSACECLRQVLKGAQRHLLETCGGSHKDDLHPENGS